MKGVIVYDSKTGNTKKLAEKIFQVLQDHYQMDLRAVNDEVDMSEYDFALVGGWNNQADLNKEIVLALEKSSQKNIGLFMTMGADPNSIHGEKTRQKLEKRLHGKNCLGIQICPGKVDDRLIKRLEEMEELNAIKEIQKKMLESSKASRWATEEELARCANSFIESIEKWTKEEKE